MRIYWSGDGEKSVQPLIPLSDRYSIEWKPSSQIVQCFGQMVGGQGTENGFLHYSLQIVLHCELGQHDFLEVEMLNIVCDQNNPGPEVASCGVTQT